MRITVGLLVMIAGIPIASAADLEAGKAKAATVCAPCHGALGVSVSDAIPKLAGQKARYIELQLNALKDGSATRAGTMRCSRPQRRSERASTRPDASPATSPSTR